MAKCTENGCKLTAEHGDTKCILHCAKGTDQLQPDRQRNFYDSLAKHTVSLIVGVKILSENEINDITKKIKSNENGPDNISGNQSTVHYQRIVFPATSTDNESIDYTNIFNKLKSISFIDCEINAKGFTGNKAGHSRYFFYKCEFNNSWLISNLPTGEYIDSFSTYSLCTFNEIALTIQKEKYTFPLFNSCIFNKLLSLSDSMFEEAPIVNINVQPEYLNAELNINKLRVSNCVFDCDFDIFSSKINSFTSNSSTYNSLFMITGSTIKSVEINKSKYKGLVEINDSNFGEFNTINTFFETTTNLDNCKFDISKAGDCTSFKYTYFNGQANFRGSNFYGGLSLRLATFNTPPNFLGTKTNPNNTDMETYRLLKHSCDRIGNHADANKYFAQEMNKQYEESKRYIFSQKRIVLLLNKYLSDFGQSYVLPAIWLTLFAITYNVLIDAQNNNYLYTIYPPFNEYINKAAMSFNSIAKSLIPFNRFLREGMEFVSLIFYVIFMSLTWLIIVALKRLTQR